MLRRQAHRLTHGVTQPKSLASDPLQIEPGEEEPDHVRVAIDEAHRLVRAPGFRLGALGPVGHRSGDEQLAVGEFTDVVRPPELLVLPLRKDHSTALSEVALCTRAPRVVGQPQPFLIGHITNPERHRAF
jgi:hypothetical protein